MQINHLSVPTFNCHNLVRFVGQLQRPCWHKRIPNRVFNNLIAAFRAYIPWRPLAVFIARWGRIERSPIDAPSALFESTVNISMQAGAFAHIHFVALVVG